MKDASDERWIAAVHESAHALVGWHFDCCVGHIEISTDHPGRGQCGFIDVTDDGNLPMTAAGRLAEQLITGPKADDDPMLLRKLSSGHSIVRNTAMRASGYDLGPDQAKIMQAFRDKGLKDPIKAFHRLEARTWRIVQALERHILAVASVLYERGEITGDDMHDIIDELESDLPLTERYPFPWIKEELEYA
jgi:hypothetical protein